MSDNALPIVDPAVVASAAGAPTEAAPPIGVGDAAKTPPVPAAGGDAPPPAAIPALEPSLLESLTASDPVKPAETKAADPAKPVEAKKPEGEAAKVEGEEPPKVELPPINYDFKLPETMKVSDEQRGELTTALDAFRADPTKGVQSLIDLHAKAMGEFAKANAEQTLVRQYETFNETRKGWQRDILADEQLGGSGHKTVMRAVARMRDRFVPQANMDKFNEFLRVTGAGDHPEFLRLLHNVAGAFDEPSIPSPNIKPPPDLGRKPGSSKAAILYGKTG